MTAGKPPPSILKRPERPAIRALPADPAAGEPPQIVFHTCIADLKTAGASPAKGLFFATTTALILSFLLLPFLFLGHGFVMAGTVTGPTGIGIGV